MPRSHKEDPELLSAALIGLQHTLTALEERIADLRGQLGGQPAAGVTKHNMSAAARKRIALAQKKRWAAFRKAQKLPSAPAPVAAAV